MLTVFLVPGKCFGSEMKSCHGVSGILRSAGIVMLFFSFAYASLSLIEQSMSTPDGHSF